MPSSYGHDANWYRDRKNTNTARKLAAMWEEQTGREFPGGQENAWLRHKPALPTVPGSKVIADMKSKGADLPPRWNWELGALDMGNNLTFAGSEHSVRESMKDPDLVDFERSAHTMGHASLGYKSAQDLSDEELEEWRTAGKEDKQWRVDYPGSASEGGIPQTGIARDPTAGMDRNLTDAASEYKRKNRDISPPPPPANYPWASRPHSYNPNSRQLSAKAGEVSRNSAGSS